MKRFKDALDCHNKALELNPQDYTTWASKGFVLADMGRFKESLECFDESLKLDSQDAYVMYGKGLSLEKLGRNKEALKSFQKALKINPDYGDAKTAEKKMLSKIDNI